MEEHNTSRGERYETEKSGETHTKGSIVQQPERGNNGLSKIPEPHEIHCYARRQGCVEWGTASTMAGSENKRLRRCVGVEGVRGDGEENGMSEVKEKEV